ncbi:MAG: sigma-70 family RNA polymerase sigma factor [Verrucomicrobiota bacterium]
MRIKDPTAEADWEEFYSLYWRVIFRYGMKLGLSEDAARDVLQETMVALLKAMPDFHYDPRKGRFLNFLLTITHRKALEAMRRSSRAAAVPIDSEPALPAPGSSGGSDHLDRLWQRSVWEEVWQRFCEDVSVEQSTIDVYRAYAIDGEPPGDVARRFRMKTNAIYRIKNRVSQRLRRETQRLFEELEAAS